MTVVEVELNTPDQVWVLDVMATGSTGDLDGWQVFFVSVGWVNCLPDDDNSYPSIGLLIHYPDVGLPGEDPIQWRTQGASGVAFAGGATVPDQTGVF